MVKVFVTLKLTRAYAQESDSVAVTGVEVGMYLKDKAGEFIFIRANISQRCGPAAGYGGNADKCVEHFTNPEVINAAAEKYRSYFTGQIIRCIQFAVNA